MDDRLSSGNHHNCFIQLDAGVQVDSRYRYAMLAIGTKCDCGQVLSDYQWTCLVKRCTCAQSINYIYCVTDLVNVFLQLDSVQISGETV